MKKTVIFVVIIAILLTVLTGCFEQEKIEQFQTNMPLDSIALSLENLPEGYQKYGEEHITEPYIVEEGKLLAGWKVLEKYEVKFLKEDYQFVLHGIARLPSVKKAHQAFKKIENAKLEYNFTKMEPPEIGEECYLGRNSTILFNHNVELIFLCFRMYDLVVVVLTSGIPVEETILYAKVVENNIKEAMGTD